MNVGTIAPAPRAWPRNGHWGGLPSCARLYLGALFTVAAVCVLVTWAWPAPVHSVEPFAMTSAILGCTAALAVFMGQQSRGQRTGGRRSSLTIDAGSVFLFAAVLLLPPRWALIPIAFWGIAGWVCHRSAWYKAFFNLALYVVGMLAVAAIAHGVLYSLLKPDAQPGRFTLVIAGGALTWAVIDAAAMAAILYLTTGVFDDRVFWPDPAEDAALATLGGIVAALYSVSWWWALLAAGAGCVAVLEVNGESHRARSLTDPKTGLVNTAGLRETLGRELARARRGAEGVSIAVLDLDHFRRVNEIYHHQGGDLALVQFGNLLRDTAREQDVVARWGGDEMVWLMPGVSLTGACAAAERFRSLVADRAFDLGGEPANLSVSIGVASWEEGMTEEEFLRRADEEVFAAKAAGRNRVEPREARWLASKPPA